MWRAYIDICINHGFAAAFVQFLVLGTLGEVLSTMLRQGTRRYPFSLGKTALKALGWGVLGLYIKVIFATAVAGVAALAAQGYLPTSTAIPRSLANALAISVLLNVALGPSMMVLHRLTDNAIDRLLDGAPPNYLGLDRSLKTLIWMWIPLHTFTFTQAQELRIGIAALLSLLLGLVMGAFTLGANKTPASSAE